MRSEASKRWPALSHEIPQLTSLGFVFHMLPARKHFLASSCFECKGNTFLYYLQYFSLHNLLLYKCLQVNTSPVQVSVQVWHKKKEPTNADSLIFEYFSENYFNCIFQLDSDGPYNPLSFSTFHSSLLIRSSIIFFLDTNSLTKSVICLGFMP